MLAEERALRDEAIRFFESRGFAAPVQNCEAVIFNDVDADGGSISAKHDIESVRKQGFPEHTLAPTAERMHRMRSAADPRGTMCPGRIFAKSKSKGAR
jgi:hypothetical protein